MYIYIIYTTITKTAMSTPVQIFSGQQLVRCMEIIFMIND